MTKLKFTYFDMDGGRGEAARLALSIAGIAFEDDRIAFTDWPALKPKTPFGATPVLEVNGQTLAQSNAINRYVGKLAGLYPENAWEAALCDEAMDTIEDLMNQIVPTLFMPEEKKIKARKELAEGPIPFFLERLEARLVERGGEYFADNRFTVADLKVYLLTHFLSSGALEFVPADIVRNAAPTLAEHCERTGDHPGIKAYYEGRKNAG